MKIGRHNSKVEMNVREAEKPRAKCNCTVRECEWGKDCLREGIVYKGEQIENGVAVFSYIGMTSGNPKERQAKHVYEWKTPNLRDRTRLFTKIWELKESNKTINVKWTKLSYAKPRKPNDKTCNLCCKEAYYIMYRDNKSKKG